MGNYLIPLWQMEMSYVSSGPTVVTNLLPSSALLQNISNVNHVNANLFGKPDKIFLDFVLLSNVANVKDFHLFGSPPHTF